jgi:hypothetical protein
MELGKQYRDGFRFGRTDCIHSFVCLTFFTHGIKEMSTFLYYELHSTNEFLLVRLCITQPAALRFNVMRIVVHALLALEFGIILITAG